VLLPSTVPCPEPQIGAVQVDDVRSPAPVRHGQPAIHISAPPERYAHAAPQLLVSANTTAASTERRSRARRRKRLRVSSRPRNCALRWASPASGRTRVDERNGQQTNTIVTPSVMKERGRLAHGSSATAKASEIRIFRHTIHAEMGRRSSGAAAGRRRDRGARAEMMAMARRTPQQHDAQYAA